MYRVTIVYNQPADPAAFDEYYSTKHLPLVRDIPHVQKFGFGRCESLDGNPPAAYALAELYFATKEDAARGFASSQGQSAAGDVANFASGGVSLLFSNEDTVLP
ncbi:ethyl tert-butyl ether degradation protein EthD [Rhodococcus pyridinivorans KG-16]|uniref:Ethyl tert-butyl ether degradation protein EthD n=1 Tax=Rhodococcus pyridinivorans KG-16 TaxID=1441730 RepID=A0A0V9UF12_9NOCA|nr:EthD family reductase [Rhodococcus pyridinivorans]KSZ56608.1 ethyl tert-butyl ether degradation protein EthD [Rhodococcus pyridinivorans KG-16]